MPVVLDKVDIGPWLNGEAGIELLTPAAEDHLRMWPVSRRANKTGSTDDEPALIKQVAVIEFAILSVGAAVRQPDRSPLSCSGAIPIVCGQHWRWKWLQAL